MTDKIEKLFTTKDIDKLKKALDRAGAKPLKADDVIEVTLQEYITLTEMDRWATNVLETTEKLHRQCAKN